MAQAAAVEEPRQRDAARTEPRHASTEGERERRLSGPRGRGRVMRRPRRNKVGRATAIYWAGAVVLLLADLVLKLDKGAAHPTARGVLGYFVIVALIWGLWKKPWRRRDHKGEPTPYRRHAASSTAPHERSEPKGTATSDQHWMISKERNLFQWTIHCSCGKQFSGYGYGSRSDAERKFQAHQADPGSGGWDAPYIPRCKVCGTQGEYGKPCRYCGSLWVS